MTLLSQLVACGGSSSDGSSQTSGAVPVFASGDHTVFNENNIGMAYHAKADDSDGDTLIYAVPEGADKDIFRIVPHTGVVAFKNPPNFESPQDADQDNVYEIGISVNDGSHTVMQAVRIQVLDVNDTISNADAIVEMRDSSTIGESSLFVFEPAYLKIEPGQTVGFKLTDSGHNTVSDLTPNQSTGWEINYTDGEVMLQEEGVYLYYCTPHKAFGMYGIIQVGDASSNKAEAIAKANSMADQFEAMSPKNAQKLRDAIAKIE